MKNKWKNNLLALCCISFMASDGLTAYAETHVSSTMQEVKATGGEAVSIRGKIAHTSGKMVHPGTVAPDFMGVNADMEEVSLSSYQGKRVILNIFPSIDTRVCAMSVRQFNEAASGLDNTVVICLSMDLPYAQSRFCAAEGLANVVTLSMFRSDDFVKSYGLQLVDSPMKGLLARAVIVIDEKGYVRYTELVKEMSNEPNYDAALTAMKAL